nr:OsmC family protein [Methanoculleus sp.]
MERRCALHHDRPELRRSGRRTGPPRRDRPGGKPDGTGADGLSACIAVGIAYSAAEDEGEVDAIEIDVEGDLDLAGFFEVRRTEGPEHEKTRSVFERRLSEGPEHEKTLRVFERRLSEGPGLAEVRLTVRVDADAPREKIEELVHHGYRRSPVAASLEGRVPIRVCIGWEETGAIK